MCIGNIFFAANFKDHMPNTTNNNKNVVCLLKLATIPERILKIIPTYIKIVIGKNVGLLEYFIYN